MSLAARSSNPLIVDSRVSLTVALARVLQVTPGLSNIVATFVYKTQIYLILFSVVFWFIYLIRRLIFTRLVSVVRSSSCPSGSGSLS